MSTSRLIFFPENASQPVDNRQVLDTLISTEFINTPAYSFNHYLPGDRFLSLLTFLGCSPNINLQPVENENHCYISLLDNSPETQFLGCTSTAKAKCPDCKKRISNWKTDDWNITGTLCHCDKCHTQNPYAELNWKHECGFARGGFEISHIYPHEAVPTDQLLNALEKSSGYKWNYTYANN